MNRLAIAAFILAASPREAASGSLEWTVSFDPGSLALGRDGCFTLVQADGMQIGGDPGTPLLPSRPVALVIDPGAVDVEFTVSFSDPERVDVPSALSPAGTPGPIGSGLSRPSRTPDPSVYLSEDPWPRSGVSGARTGHLGGFSVASCVITPWEYRPLSNELTLFRTARIRLEWDGSAPVNPLTVEQIRSAEARVALLVDNAEEVASHRPPVRPGRAGDAVWTAICDSSSTEALEPLRAMWEDSPGSASILTIQEIEQASAGADSAERLRNAIRDLWLEHGAVYVLLAGDESLVPARIVRTLCEGLLDNAPVDHYFSDLDGDWDLSGDEVYGQPEDSLDLYMDVLLGRALFSTAGQADVFVQKTIGYATDPPGGSWSTTALLCGAMLFEEIGYIGGKSCDTLSAALPASWEVIRVYEEPSVLDGSDTHIEYLQDGTGWNYYAGHGNVNGVWWSDPPYTMMSVSLAQDLSNGTRTGIHTSIACHPGDFCDYLQCCAEALLQNPDGGAVSVTFNTTYGWEGYWPEMGASEWMCILFTRAVFLDHLPTLGDAFASAKDQRIPYIHGPFDRNLQSILAWTAFQDPALRPLGVRGDTPVPPTEFSISPPWPNPSMRGAPVNFSVGFTGGTAELSAWDMAGRLLWRQTASGIGTYQWDGRLPDGSRAPAGVYIISARRGDMVLSRRAAILD